MRKSEEYGAMSEIRGRREDVRETLDGLESVKKGKEGGKKSEGNQRATVETVAR